MRELIKKLFEKWSCRHTWTIWSRTQVKDAYSDEYYTRTRLLCEKCGKFKKFEET